ncbi:MAG: MBL fold metallo-hydrolase [Phycisphaeraceae bacterium]
MQIKFVGGIETVTGSCTLGRYTPPPRFAVPPVQFLVDCGMYQGEKDDEALNCLPFPFKVEDLRFVFLTHAHLDHCGLIPRLYKEGFRGEVVCTRATARFAKHMLADAAKQGGPYDQQHVEMIRYRCLDDDPKFGWSGWIPIYPGLYIHALRSSHVLGAVSFALSWAVGDREGADPADNPTIVFSGDIGNNTDENPYRPLLKANQRPRNTADYIVLESTYGSRDREEKYCKPGAAEAALREVILETVVGRQGNVVIPAFALQRTQEVLYLLDRILQHKGLVQADLGHRPLPEKDRQRLVKGATPRWVHTRIAHNPLLSDAERKSLLQCCEFTSAEPGKNERDDPAEEVDTICEEAVNSQTIRRLVQNPKHSKLVRVKLKQALTADQRQQFDERIRTLSLPQGLEVRVDSPLALRFTDVFGEELVRQNSKKPGKFLYLDQTVCDDWGEAGVEARARRIFPPHEEKKGSGYRPGFTQHGIRYKQVTPGAKTDYKLGKQIFVSSGGMCEGGAGAESSQGGAAGSSVYHHPDRLPVAQHARGQVVATGSRSRGQ